MGCVAAHCKSSRPELPLSLHAASWSAAFGGGPLKSLVVESASTIYVGEQSTRAVDTYWRCCRFAEVVRLNFREESAMGFFWAYPGKFALSARRFCWAA
jgi:hypothetical protein